MLHNVFWQTYADASEETDASVFRLQKIEPGSSS
jgi:hypothetical protein